MGMMDLSSGHDIELTYRVAGYSGVAWEHRIVGEIDKSLSEWTATLPDHRTSLLPFVPPSPCLYASGSEMGPHPG